MNKGAIVAVAAVVLIGAGVLYAWPSFKNSLNAYMDGQNPWVRQEQTKQDSADKMTGTWRSNTDAKFTRTIEDDGVVIDRYEGDMGAGLSGTWEISTPAVDPGIPVPATNFAGMTIVKIVWEGGVETTYFVINKINSTSMTTTDLSGRGEVTVYTKIK